jgi:hypothetical protein
MQPLSLPNRDAIIFFNWGYSYLQPPRIWACSRNAALVQSAAPLRMSSFTIEDIVHLFDLSRFDPALC